MPANVRVKLFQPALLNQIGIAHDKLGHYEESREAYERAADWYAERGLDDQALHLARGQVDDKAAIPLAGHVGRGLLATVEKDLDLVARGGARRWSRY